MVSRPGPIRHMCSGFHAASIMLSRHAGWSIDDYWRPDHPSQLAARDAVARSFDVRPDGARHGHGRLRPGDVRLPAPRGRPGLRPAGRSGGRRGRRGAAWRRPGPDPVRDAMLAAPEMVGGSRDRLDTALAVVVARPLVAKSGRRGPARRRPAARGARPTLGRRRARALKIEDGGDQRGSHVATVEALRQLGVARRAGASAAVGVRSPRDA